MNRVPASPIATLSTLREPTSELSAGVVVDGMLLPLPQMDPPWMLEAGTLTALDRTVLSRVLLHLSQRPESFTYDDYTATRQRNHIEFKFFSVQVVPLRIFAALIEENNLLITEKKAPQVASIEYHPLYPVGTELRRNVLIVSVSVLGNNSIQIFHDVCKNAWESLDPGNPSFSINNHQPHAEIKPTLVRSLMERFLGPSPKEPIDPKIKTILASLNSTVLVEKNSVINSKVHRVLEEILYIFKRSYKETRFEYLASTVSHIQVRCFSQPVSAASVPWSLAAWLLQKKAELHPNYELDVLFRGTNTGTDAIISMKLIGISQADLLHEEEQLFSSPKSVLSATPGNYIPSPHRRIVTSPGRMPLKNPIPHQGTPYSRPSPKPSPTAYMKFANN